MIDHAESEVLCGYAGDRLDGITEPDDAALFEADQSPEVDARRRAMVVVVRDRDRHDDIDRLATELLIETGFGVDACVHVKSKKAQIRKAIETAVVGGIDLVITIGGVGVGPRDKAPEATHDVLDQELPGVSQALRASAARCGAIDAVVSRGISGVSGSTVVVNMARSPEALRDGMTTLQPLVHHLADQLRLYSVESLS